MQTLTKTVLLASALFITIASTTAHAQPNTQTKTPATETQHIKEVILAYGRAMNASDVDGVLSLYTKDAVFMPARKPTATGLTQIKAAYEHEFKIIDLDVNIVFDEVVQNGNMAFARTRSEGQLNILETGKVVSTESYRAFFVLEKNDNTWKITRFLFNFTR
ncbi:MAG TPA: SgcJ/EcaC family oxidoreductase [Gammaproteobacteria bacterium]|nr:SgcJ/EcaC family oxidoreductase [Gammaproteobacteria bacterium]